MKEWTQKRLPTVTLCSTAGHELLEVWYYGELLTVKGAPQPYIVDGDEAPGLVAARDPKNGEELFIFDSGWIPWEQVKRDGIDYIALYYVNVSGRGKPGAGGA